MKKSLLFVLIALLGMPIAAAAAISGNCSGCHTMHNSQENVPVARTGIGVIDQTGTEPTSSPLASGPQANLLKYDCIACHAQNKNKIENLESSQVPQVYHQETAELAGGNFRHITDGGNRKGHNVRDLFENGDDTDATTYQRPPGFRLSGSHTQDIFGANFSNFTCAGAAGCHGTRNQNISGSGLTGDPRRGMTAISGAHHATVEAKKTPGQNQPGIHDGSLVAAGYRFIPGLKGLGADDWQNTDGSNHNEYFGAATAVGQDCGTCHVNEVTARGTESQMLVPNQSMSGFCSTCHGDFHSSTFETRTENGVVVEENVNGVSGAFLRHPSDYVLPAGDTEYAAYLNYKVSAPVARPASTFDAVTFTTASDAVTPGTDMVMCLSCHKAHASEYDAMLRFDYNAIAMQAGGNLTGAGREGCLACHTTK